MLIWIFGDLKSSTVNVMDPDRASGILELERARVRWFLSINYDDVPEEVKAKKVRTYRLITIQGTELEFSEGFTDLHTRSYEGILAGNGFGLKEASKSIALAHHIRNSPVVAPTGDHHPFVKRTAK
jgi:UDP-N-acetyl-2-amino-2-deoxyglucuronate dehydrogenase